MPKLTPPKLSVAVLTAYSFEPAVFASSMSISALVNIRGVEETSGTLIAKFDGVVRGLQSNPTMVPFGPLLGKMMYLMMCYANADGETLSFSFEKADSEKVDLSETLNFAKDTSVGNAFVPQMFTSAPAPTSAPTRTPTPAASSTHAHSYGFFNPAFYASTMTVTALIKVGGIEQSEGTLVAYADNTIHGVQDSPTLVPFGPHAGKSMYLMVVYANANGEAMSFSYDTSTSSTKLSEEQFFVKDQSLGSVLSPLTLSNAVMRR